MSTSDTPLTDTQIAKSATRGALATVARSGIVMVVQTASALVVAHRLAPRSYGIFGLALTLVGAVRYVGDLGVTFRLEVLGQVDSEDLRRGLAIGLSTAVMGAVIVSVIWQVLPLVQTGPTGARFVVPALALTLLANAPAGPATALLARRLAFKTIATGALLVSLLFYAIQLPLLIGGLGIWALVIGYVSASTVSVAYLLVASGGVPLPRLRRPVVDFVRKSFPYQAPLLAQAAVGLIVSGLVAAMLGARGIGLFTWSTILATPLITIVFTLEGVVAPSLARMLRDDGSRYAEATDAVLLTFATLAATGAAAYIGLVPSIVHYIFGARWQPAVGAVQLALAGAVPLSLVAGCASILNSQDRPGQRVRSSLAAGATALLFTVPLTLAADVTGAAIVYYVLAPLVEFAILAPGARVRFVHIAIHIARIAVPLAALSIVLEHVVSSPASFAITVVVAALAAIVVLLVSERALVSTLWRQIRTRVVHVT